MPHLGIDPVMTAVQIAQTLQTVITRNRHPLEAAVLSITQIHAGSADNVIPTDAVMAGTVRTFTLETLDLIENRMREVAQHTAAAMGAEVDFSFTRVYPSIIPLRPHFA
jgi:hippurate hydrolase